jgi:hypothetical protein
MRTDISNFIRTMTAIEQRHAYALESYSKAAGNKMVAYARRNRPWKDRTYEAKFGIYQSTQWLSERMQISLHSAAEYGIYLEFVDFAHKGRLSIWWPTVQRMAPEIIRGWADAISR